MLDFSNGHPIDKAKLSLRLLPSLKRIYPRDLGETRPDIECLKEYFQDGTAKPKGKRGSSNSESTLNFILLMEVAHYDEIEELRINPYDTSVPVKVDDSEQMSSAYLQPS